MKTLMAVILAGLMGATFLHAGEASEADKKWGTVVEKMITEGAVKISTPSAERVAIAKALAQKHGRKAEVAKTDTGYRISIPDTSVVAK